MTLLYWFYLKSFPKIIVISVDAESEEVEVIVPTPSISLILFVIFVGTFDLFIIDVFDVELVFPTLDTV